MKPRHALVLLPLLLTGCTDEEGPTAADLEARVFSLLGGLEVGQVLLLEGEDASTVFLPGGARGNEFVYVPFFADVGGRGWGKEPEEYLIPANPFIDVEIDGENVREVPDEHVRALAPGITAALPGTSRAHAVDWAAHARFLEQSRRVLVPLIPSARRAAPGPRLSAGDGQGRAVAPSVGDLIRLNASFGYCDSPDFRDARVEAVSDRAIVAVDLTSPAGLTRDDYRSFAERFDAQIHGVVTRNFGEPTDIDENGRVIVFFTPSVNRYGALGLTHPRDVFPRTVCPASNFAELLYLAVPDPQGELNFALSVEDLRQIAPGVLGHEYQHVINFGRRLWVTDAETFEEPWLDEGLSWIATELLFYAASGLEPRTNITLQALTSSEQVLQAAVTYNVVSSLLWYTVYLMAPEGSLMGSYLVPQSIGAAWAFLRYAADHEPGADDQFFRGLVDSPVAGVASLTRVLGQDALQSMQAWTVSVYTDDHVDRAAAAFTQPSWHFRSIIPAFFQDRRFPLAVHGLGPDDPVRLDLPGGGAAFVRIQPEVSRQAVVTATSTGAEGPGRLRVSVVRVR